MYDYIIPLNFKKCTTASPMNTNMEMNPKAFRKRRVSCIITWKNTITNRAWRKRWEELGND